MSLIRSRSTSSSNSAPSLSQPGSTRTGSVAAAVLRLRCVRMFRLRGLASFIILSFVHKPSVLRRNHSNHRHPTVRPLPTDPPGWRPPLRPRQFFSSSVTASRSPEARSLGHFGASFSHVTFPRPRMNECQHSPCIIIRVIGAIPAIIGFTRLSGFHLFQPHDEIAAGRPRGAPVSG